MDGLLESSKKEEDKFEEARLLEEVGLPRELLPIVVRINARRQESERRRVINLAVFHVFKARTCVIDGDFFRLLSVFFSSSVLCLASSAKRLSTVFPPPCNAPSEVPSLMMRR